MNVPKLRFKEFDGEWEEKKLDSFVTFYSGLTYSPDDIVKEKGTLVLRSSNVQFGSIVNADNVYVNPSVVNSEDVLEGDIIVVVRNGSRNLIGKHAQVKRAMPNTVIGAFMTGIRSKVPNFLNVLLDTKQFQKEINKNLGATINQITTGSFKKMSFLVSENIKEQEKIGNFFEILDKKIQLQQQKIDLLQEQKKGFLQKMFPKAGETQPEMRFDGFIGDWEECKLREVANHRGGTAIEKYFDDNGDYKVISIGSYGLDNKYVDQNIRAISNDITDSRLVKKGELTMVLNDKTSNGTIIGRSLLIEKDNEFVVNQRTEIISPKTAFDSAFAYVTLNGPFREKVRKIVQGGTQIYVNYSAVENLNLLVPQIEEQKKIGSFFKQLDNVITFQQQKLELFQKQKDGFMQQMFI